MNVNLELLERFPLLSRLGESQRRLIAQGARLITANEGQTICTEGTSAPRIVFLVSGDVVLSQRGEAIQTVRAGTARAALPVADGQPALFTARARLRCTLLEVDSRLVQDAPADRPAAGGYEVVEIETADSETWVRLLLRARAFLRLPAHNIQAIVSSSTEIPVRAGQHVVQQGEPATDYYMIKAGRFRVARLDTDSARETELAILDAGSAFGEDALISHGRRGASVIALENGSVIRLSKQDFTNFVVNPVLKPISPQEATDMAERGAALIDVRAPEHHRSNGLPNSINIPLLSLRSQATRLERGRECVVYCDNGNLSAAAAFVLGQYGLRTYLLAGGLSGAARRPAPMAAAAT